MSDRESLAELMRGMRTGMLGVDFSLRLADVVIAARWRPPARVVADGGEIEAIAVEWMRYLGYTAEQIAEAEAHSCADTCERVGDAWDCADENGDSHHPVADELSASVAMANVAMETIEARGWRPPAREIADPSELVTEARALADRISGMQVRESVALIARNLLRQMADRIDELETAASLEAEYDVYLKCVHGIDSTSEQEDFQQWQQDNAESSKRRAVVENG